MSKLDALLSVKVKPKTHFHRELFAVIRFSLHWTGEWSQVFGRWQTNRRIVVSATKHRLHLSVREEEEYSKTEGAVVGCCRCWSGLCYCRLQLIAFSPAAPLLLDAGWLIVTSMRLLPNVRCRPLSHPSRESRWKTIAIAGYFTDGWLD